MKKRKAAGIVAKRDAISSCFNPAGKIIFTYGGEIVLRRQAQ